MKVLPRAAVAMVGIVLVVSAASATAGAPPATGAGSYATGAERQPRPKTTMRNYEGVMRHRLSLNDADGALTVMKEMVELARRYNVALPDHFHYDYADVAVTAGEWELAFEAASHYLRTAKPGTFRQRMALAILETVQDAMVMELEMCGSRGCARK